MKYVINVKSFFFKPLTKGNKSRETTFGSWRCLECSKDWGFKKHNSTVFHILRNIHNDFKLISVYLWVDICQRRPVWELKMGFNLFTSFNRIIRALRNWIKSMLRSNFIIRACNSHFSQSCSFQIRMITNGNSALLESFCQECMLPLWMRTWNHFQWVFLER